MNSPVALPSCTLVEFAQKYNELTGILGEAVAPETIEKLYLKSRTPDPIILGLYLGDYQNAAEAVANTDKTVTMHEFYQIAHSHYMGGVAVLRFLDTHVINEHPTDKRFLLLYMWKLCKHYNLHSHKTPGFGHDLIYSVEPLSDCYTVFDNSLYLAPTEGYWAIALRGARD